MRSGLLVVVAAIGLVAVSVPAWLWWAGRSSRAPLTPATPATPAPKRAAAPAAIGPIHFTEMTATSGVDFIHRTGTSAEKPFPAANGSGAAAFDFDLDGLYDLYFATGTPFPIRPSATTPRNQLYRNRGGWSFEKITGPSGLGHDGYSAGLAVGDYDSDGFPDVYVSCFGPDVLYRNNGDGTFSKQDRVGLGDPRWGASAAFLDYDGDSFLDLYVCNYGKWTYETNQFCGDRARKVRIYCSPNTVAADDDGLYRNAGDGQFSDVTHDAGVAGPAGRSQGVVAADVNGDGLIDLYIGNDLHPNSLLLNEGGKFRDESENSGTAYNAMGQSQAGMGVDCADLDGDGLAELFVTNFENEYNACYRNLGKGLFQDESSSFGLAAASLPWVGWGTALTDLDLDGWPDVIVTNGHVDDNLHLLGRDAPWAEPALVWRNIQGRFELATAGAGEYFTQPHPGRGLATADLDNDGDSDVVIVHQDAAPALLRNDRLPAAGKVAITLRLIGTRSNRDAVGATIRFQRDGRTIVQQVKGGGSYLCAHDLRQVLAVGSRVGPVEILWPSGTRSVVSDLEPGGQYLAIEPAEENAQCLTRPDVSR